MANMNSPSSEYLKKYLIEKSMTKAQKARGETPSQKKRRQQQQADKKKNDPTRKKQVANMTSKYDKGNPESRKTRDQVATAKSHPNGDSAKELKNRGLDVKNKKCSKCGSTNNLHADHVNQHTNSKYKPNGRLRWLCNNCHQSKTASERTKRGQKENQYGHAKNESFENKLHGSLQALLEAKPKENEPVKRRRRAQKQRNRELEGRRDQPQSDLPPPRSTPKETDDPSTWDIGRPIQKRPSKPRKVGGRRIIPKYKEKRTPVLYFRRHPQYKDVLQIVDTSGEEPLARKITNDLYRRLNTVEYHRVYKLNPESLEKYGLTSDVISGNEIGIEEDTVYEFILKDFDTTLLSRSYTTDFVTYSFRDHSDGQVHQGHVLRIDDDPNGPGKIVLFRDLTDRKFEIVTNERIGESDTSYYRYGRPSSKPEVVNEYYWAMDDDGKKIKKHVWETGGSYGLYGDDSYSSDDLFDAIDSVAPEIAAEEMRNIFLRDAYQQAADEWAVQNQGSQEVLSAKEHEQLARRRYMQIITSEEGKKRIAKRTQEIIDEPSADVKRKAIAHIKNTRRPQKQRRALPKNVQLHEDPRPAAKIFDVTRESGKVEGDFDNPADLNKSVYTLYNVEVDSPNPDHTLMRYLINGYRPEKDYMSNYQAVIPRMMLDGPPKEVDKSVVLLRVKKSETKVDEETGEKLSPWEVIRINVNDIIDDEIVSKSRDDRSFFAEIDQIREAYKAEVEDQIMIHDNPEVRKKMEEALAGALSETKRQMKTDEKGTSPETDDEYMDRTNVRKLPLDERTLNFYNFYSEKEENGEVIWPALEISEIRQNFRLGLTKEIRYAIPKSVRVYDTFDMQGNLHKGILSSQKEDEYGWLNRLTHSDNYDSFGMLKPTSERSMRHVTSSVGMRFRSAMSPAEFALGIINPYLMKLDPERQSAYVERSFDNAWQDPERRKIMERRALTTMATQRALDKTGSDTEWYNLGDAERTKRIKAARQEVDKDFSDQNENIQQLVRTQALENFRLQSLSSLNRQMGNIRNVCPKCAGQQYLRIIIDQGEVGDISNAKTQQELRTAIKTGQVQYQKATLTDYNQSKKNKMADVIICNACGGTGQKLKEKTATLYAGQKSREIDYNAFMAAMDEALDFDEDPTMKKSSKLVSRTIKALFPSKLTELTRTNIPAAQLKPFLKALSNVTAMHLAGKVEAEGALNPVRGAREIGGKPRDCLTFRVDSPEGPREFIAPVNNNGRYLAIQNLVDEYAGLPKIPDESSPIFIEGKEDQESYILDSILGVVSGGFKKYDQSSMPDVLHDYRQMAAANYEALSPEGKQAFLQGNQTEKLKFEEMIEGLTSGDNDQPIVGENQAMSLIRPWATKTILQIVYVKRETGLASLNDLAIELRKLDRNEDPEINRDSKFYIMAAEAYRRALLDMDIEKNDFINNDDVLHKYWTQILIGDTRPMFDDEIEERMVVELGCKDVSTGQDTILKYNLDKNPDQRVMRVWDASVSRAVARTPQKELTPDDKEQIAQKRQEDALSRFEMEGRVPLTRKIEDLGGSWKIANNIFNKLKKGKVISAAETLRPLVAKQSNPERTIKQLVTLLTKFKLPKEMIRQIRSTLLEGPALESKASPILMIAEEIDSGAGNYDNYTPEDVANWID